MRKLLALMVAIAAVMLMVDSAQACHKNRGTVACVAPCPPPCPPVVMYQPCPPVVMYQPCPPPPPVICEPCPPPPCPEPCVVVKEKKGCGLLGGLFGKHRRAAAPVCPPAPVHYAPAVHTAYMTPQPAYYAPPAAPCNCN